VSGCIRGIHGSLQKSSAQVLVSLFEPFYLKNVIYERTNNSFVIDITDIPIRQRYHGPVLKALE
jgi:hypothetical protein